MEGAELRIRLLGGLAVDGFDETRVGSRQGRKVLKLLALARSSPVAADRIAEVLWGLAPPARPQEQVGVLVSRLRSVIGPHRIDRTDAGYALSYDWLDIVELEARVVEAERRADDQRLPAARGAAEAALALVRGPLLPDEDGEWVDIERVRADTLVQRARRVLAASALDARDYGLAVAAAEEVLADDPYDEAALRTLMRAHAAAGRSGAALVAYDRMCERLDNELGITPSEETRSLHATIVSTPDAHRPAPGQQRRAIVGRDDERRLLVGALDDASAGATRIVLIEGEAGIGKTTLLDATAGDAEDRGFLVVTCNAGGAGGNLPLQPVLDGLFNALRAAGPDAAAVALGSDDVIVGPFLGWSTPSAPSAFTTLRDASSARSLQFAAVVRTVERLASGRPVLIAVDGIDHADETTIEWLLFAARRMASCMLIGARRLGARQVLEDAQLIKVGPLDVDAAIALVGSESAGAHFARSGGNPLFLIELSRTSDEISPTIRDAVASRAAALGSDAAQTIATAALLAPELDLDLIAGVLRRSIDEILDVADAACAAAILTERGSTYAFDHDLVRDALAAQMTAARRAHLHRAAAGVLASRARADWRRIAWHAKLGGDHPAAAEALHQAALEAVRRYDLADAGRLLDEAIALDDGTALRLARARVRLARWDAVAAAEDAETAIAMGAGAEGFEVAGWAAYYARDYDSARRFADEGVSAATDPGMRASCLALGGRTRHSRGSLAEAEPLLVESARCEVPEIRNVATTWLSVLRAHQGRAEETLELAERALVDPARFAHPFARFFALLARSLALGMSGRVLDTLNSAERFEAEATRAGEPGARFISVAKNASAWPLRAIGAYRQAEEVLRESLELTAPDVPSFAEPRYAAALDLAEMLIDAGDVAAASVELDHFAPRIRTWNGTMSWRARQRLTLVEARRQLAEGDVDEVRPKAHALAIEAGRVGNMRHALLARGLEARAAALQGDAEPDLDALDAVLDDLNRCAAFEGWLVTAELASAYKVDRWWMDAQRRAEALIASAGPRAEEARRHVGRAFEKLGHGR